MKQIKLGGVEYYPTEGCFLDGVKIAGLFEGPTDMDGDSADDLASGTIAWETLTPEQQAVATANSLESEARIKSASEDAEPAPEDD